MFFMGVFIFGRTAVSSRGSPSTVHSETVASGTHISCLRLAQIRPWAFHLSSLPAAYIALYFLMVALPIQHFVFYGMWPGNWGSKKLPDSKKWARPPI